jgi:hypothetical protein
MNPSEDRRALDETSRGTGAVQTVAALTAKGI